MKDAGVKKLVTAALFAALVCISTIILVVPLPGGGFANLGDCVVIAAGCLLGPCWGAAAAAIGAALADVFLGYMIYFPASLVVKGLMALCACGVLRFNSGGGTPSVLATLVASFAAELVMIGGYFAYEFFLLGPGAATADLIGNAMQASAGMMTGAVLLNLLLRSSRLREILK